MVPPSVTSRHSSKQVWIGSISANRRSFNVAHKPRARSAVGAGLMGLLCSIYLNEFAYRRRWRYRFTRAAQFFYMEFNGFPDKGNHFFSCLSSGNTPREIRNMCSVAGRPFFYNNHIFHDRVPLQLSQTRLFQNARQCTGWNVYARLPRHGDNTRLRRMSKLTVATFHPYLRPSIHFQQFNKLLRLHMTIPVLWLSHAA